MRKRVIKARAIQAKRYAENKGMYANAQMTSKKLRALCQINQAGQHLLKTAMDCLSLSARAYSIRQFRSRELGELGPLKY